MKKNIVLLLLIVSIILNVISGVYFLNINPETKEESIESATINKETNSGKYVINEISDEIKNDSTFNSCMTNNTNYCLNQYINENAVKNSDYNLCKKLTDPNIASSCKEIVILNLSAKNNDTKICEELGDKKSYCVSQILTKKALETLDITVCDDIYDEKATNTGTLSNGNYESTCKNNVLMQLAASKKDKSICYKMDDKSMIEICKNTVEMTK